VNPSCNRKGKYGNPAPKAGARGLYPSIHEPHMEKEPVGGSGHWSIAASQVGLPVVLASIRRVAEFSGARIPNLSQIPVTRHSCIPFACGGSLGISGKASALLRTFAARYRVCCGGADRKICVGIEAHDLCVSRAVGDRIGVERLASSNRDAFGLL